MESRLSQKEQKLVALKAAETWRRPGIERRLEDILSEPLVKMVMQRDGVSKNDLQEMMHLTQARLTKASPSPSLKH